MNILYSAYNILSSFLFLSGLPAFLLYSRITGNNNYGIKERLGYIPIKSQEYIPEKPRIWIHAVSLGEVRVAEPIVKELKRMIPECVIIISTTTRHGRDLAHDIFGNKIPLIYAPIDFIGSVRKALKRVKPKIIVFLETEIWPIWLTEANRMGIKTCLINGRISERSIKIYLRLRPFFRFVLNNFRALSMISDIDRSRIESMGADPKKIFVNGNAKYDLLPSLIDPSMETEMRQLLNLDSSSTVFVAGSTREGEELLILKAYKIILNKYPDTILIIAPRHIERANIIKELIEKKGFRCQLRSSLCDSTKRNEKIVIMDSFGELFKLYSVGTIVFCGASLVPLGGQNPLEAAVWGKPVLYGPSMEDFLDAKALLEKNKAGIMVSSHESLAEETIRLLSSHEVLKAYGERAEKTVLMRRNASEKHAKVVAELIS